MPNIYKIRIFNKEYSIQTEESEEYTNELAAKLNQKLAEIIQGTASMTPLDGAVLVALDCLDRSIKTDKTIDKIRGQIKEYVDKDEINENRIKELEARISELEGKAPSAAVKSRADVKGGYDHYKTNFEKPSKDRTDFVPDKNGQTSFFNKK